MEIKKLEQELKEYLSQNGCKLYRLNYRKGKENILEVLIDEHLDLSGIAKVSELVSSFLDRYDDQFEEAYLLDVSTVGLERELEDLNDIIAAKGHYVYVKFKRAVEPKAIYGTLEEVDGEVITLSYMDKNIKRKLTFNFDDIKFIRLAVKF